MNLLHFELSQSTDDGGHLVQVQREILVHVDDAEHLLLVKSLGSHVLTKFEDSLMLEGDFALARYDCFGNAAVSFKSKLQFFERDSTVAIFVKNSNDTVDGSSTDVELELGDVSSKERRFNFLVVISIADSKELFDAHILFL